MNSFTWAILAAFIWGVVPLLEKLALAKVEPLVGLFYRCLGVVMGVLLLSIFVLKPQEIKTVDSRSVIFLLASGFLASFLAQICFYKGLKIGEISRVVPISGSYPLMAFIIGVLFLGESINLTKLLGVALIVLGIWTLRI